MKTVTDEKAGSISSENASSISIENMESTQVPHGDKPFTAEHLHDALKKIQEAHGFYFNDDQEMTMDILESLVVMHNRHGYMACPCRLVTGSYEHDRDIICPCVYRDGDVAEFGACFCGLYVSEGWRKGTVEHCFVPDRRPVHLASAACDVHQERYGRRHKDCE